MKNSKFGLKNFRVFDDKGAEFEIAPITVITGGNSSGKSSVFKSLMLLNKLLNGIINDYNKDDEFNLFDYKLDFHLGKHNLGTYEKTLSRLAKTDEITFSYSIYSDLIDDLADVFLIFQLDKTDFLNRAILHKIEIRNENHSLFTFEINHADKNVIMKCDVLKLKTPFINLMMAQKHLYDPIINELTEDASPYSPEDVKGYESEEDIYPLYENEQYDELLKKVIRLKTKDLSGNFFNDILTTNDKLNFNDLSMLFYLPIEKYFDSKKKMDLLKVFDDLITQNIDNESLKDNDFQISLNVIKIFMKSFVDSKEKDFIEYYKKFEDLFLMQKFSNIEMKLNQTTMYIIGAKYMSNTNFLVSLMGKTSVSNPPLGTFLNTLYNSFYGHNVKMDELTFDLRSQENINQNFLILYFSFCKFFICFDEIFSKDRLEGATDSEIISYGQYFEYMKPLEYETFSNFIFAFTQEVLIDVPSFLHDNTFIDAVRANVQRMYTFKSQGTDFNILMNSYLNNLKTRQKSSSSFDKKYVLGTFMKKWIKEFDIADDILFEMTEDGLGVHIYTIKDKIKTLLADEGYGITQLLSILLQIELNILKSPYTYKHPFVLYYVTKYKESTISIEEPEVNLHPKFQSKLADMFVDAYKNYNVRFMLETHSEYLVRKLQTLVAKKEIQPTDVSIQYIYPHDKKKRPKNTPQVLKINILEDGRLDKPFGVGFFDEADNLALDLLTFKTLN